MSLVVGSSWGVTSDLWSYSHPPNPISLQRTPAQPPCGHVACPGPQHRARHSAAGKCHGLPPLSLMGVGDSSAWHLPQA